MQGRIIVIINILLVGVCIYCVYYLATTDYAKPTEVTEAQQYIRGAETTMTTRSRTETLHGGVPLPPPPVHETPAKPNVYANINNKKNPFEPFYTPTPTPVPTPTPTPVPADLGLAVANWQLQSLDENKATFTDPQTNDTFEMTVGGPLREAKDNQNRVLHVKLVSVDLNETKAMLGCTESPQTVPKQL
jgi:hypothetical protein